MTGMANIGNHPTFLATTALEEFWDTKQHLVFLGGWCHPFGGPTHAKDFVGEVIENPWNSPQSRVGALHTCNSLTDKLLVVLAKSLNDLHSRQHTTRYWRILLEPWLHYYVSTMYDLFVRIELAAKTFPLLTSIGLPEACFIVPAGTAEFDQMVKTDFYILQLCTRIMSFLGIPFSTRPGALCVRCSEAGGVSSTWLACTRRACNAAFRLFGARDCILLRSSHFSRETELRLFVRTLGRVRRITPSELRPEPQPIQHIPRSTLCSCLPERTRFQQLLRATLPLDIPQVLVEAYERHGTTQSTVYSERPNVIFTANAHYHDDTFKRFAAGAADRGAVLLGTPHGTNYGVAAWSRSRDYDANIFDRYYTWGWNLSDCSSRVVPMPAGKLIGRTRVGADNRQKGILWATTTASRYLREFPYTPELFSIYLEWQQRFLAALSPEARGQLTLRPHHEDQGWSIVARLRREFPCLKIEDWTSPFIKSLSKRRLYVCDHLSTTFGEALAADRPTVLFWNREANELTSQARPYFDSLCKVGILFYDPIEAAACVDQIYGDVEDWWNEPERQDARRQFCDRFARTASDAVKLWSREFLKVLKGAAASSQAQSGRRR